MTPLQGLHLHLDPVSGIAGDMTVAALVDAGVPASVVIQAVRSVGVRGLKVRFEQRQRGAFVGRGFVVDQPAPLRGERQPKSSAGHLHAIPVSTLSQHHDHDHGHVHVHGHGPDHLHAPPRARPSSRPRPHATVHAHDHRDYAEIRRLLARSTLNSDAKELAQEIFRRLAEVEAALHGSPVDRVTFHEVGAYDSIADIVGMSAAIAWLAPSSIGSSPPVLGTGTINSAHGVVPIPAPATAALLRGIAVIADGEGELTTPTGAAFLATVVDTFGPPPPMRIVAVGYGAGTRVLVDRANVLRVMFGEPIGKVLAPAAEQVLVLESNIDDMSGQLLSALFDALFKAGALDVWSTAIVMKKGRPAHQISALVEPGRAAEVERAFFLNSTTLGIRRYQMSRSTLARSIQLVDTPYGPVRVKMAALDGAAIGGAPEYEDCRRQAAAADVPVRRVWEHAVAAVSRLEAATVSSARAPAARGGQTRARKRSVPP